MDILEKYPGTGIKWNLFKYIQIRQKNDKRILHNISDHRKANITRHNSYENLYNSWVPRY